MSKRENNIMSKECIKHESQLRRSNNILCKIVTHIKHFSNVPFCGLLRKIIKYFVIKPEL